MYTSVYVFYTYVCLIESYSFLLLYINLTYGKL